MSTSGITTYQLDRDSIIKAAMRKTGVLAQGQSPSTEDYNNAVVALNALIAEFRSIGMPLWERKSYSFGLTANTQVYQIGLGKTLNTVFPLHLLQAYRQDSGNTTKVPMEIISNYNFNTYPTSSGGTPIQITYQPFINYGELSVWPTPDSNAAASTTITIIYTAPFQYFNASADNLDFPEEWYNAIFYGLASLLAPEWGLSIQERQMLSAEARMHLESAKENGQEDASFRVIPEVNRGKK